METPKKYTAATKLIEDSLAACAAKGPMSGHVRVF